MTNFDSLSKSQKIRATIHKDVRYMCTETCHFLGLEITKPAMEVIAELVYKKLSVYGSDLEAFAKHAKRTTINSEDVKLLVRRNPSLKSHVSSLAPAPTSTTKDKRRKTVASTARLDTPAKNDSAKPNDETSSTKPLDTPAKPKDDAKEDPTKIDEIEDMVIDDTIDLTFD